MDFFVVFMECRRYFAVKRQWISNPVVGTETKIYFSRDGDAVPNYELELESEFYLNQKHEACYNVFVLKSFGE